MNLAALLQSPIGNRVLFFFLAAVIGMVVGLATVALIGLIELVQFVGFGGSSETKFAEIAAQASPIRVLLAPLIGGLIVGAILYFLPGRRYHGIADVMEACAFHSGRMGARSGLGAAMAAAVSLGSGAPLGREGPAVHIGASISAWLADKLGLNRRQSLALLGCGAAAAVTTSFNAPIAGVLFALEVIVGYYTLRVFAPVVIASVVAVIVREQFFGSGQLFDIPEYTLRSLWELPLFALLGIIGAVLVSGFIVMVSAIEKGWHVVHIPPWVRPGIAGLIIGLLAFHYPMILSVGYEPVLAALRETLSLTEMLLLLVLKVFGTALAIGSGFAGGVFSPSVFLGAMLGGVYCFFLGGVGLGGLELSGSGVYSIVGIAGVASAMLGAPISTVLIVFEVTRNYDITVAVMVAAAFASTVMQFGKHSSFFRWQLSKRGVNISEGRDISLLMTQTVDRLVNKRYTRIEPGATLGMAESLLGSERQRIGIVLDDEDHYAGCIDLRELVTQSIEHGADALMSEHMLDASTAVSADTNVVAALQNMAKYEIDYMPVTSGSDEEFLGVIFKSDLLTEHYEVLRKAREEEFGVN